MRDANRRATTPADPAVLAVRSALSPGSPLFPIPGEVIDSILLDAQDGIPRLHRAGRVEVDGPVKQLRGPSVRRARVAVIVTDHRLAVASSGYVPPAERTRCSAMLVGHLPFPWITEVRAVRRFGRCTAVRVRFDHPLGAGMALLVGLATAAEARALAADVQARCEQHANPVCANE